MSVHVLWGQQGGGQVGDGQQWSDQLIFQGRHVS